MLHIRSSRFWCTRTGTACFRNCTWSRARTGIILADLGVHCGSCRFARYRAWSLTTRQLPWIGTPCLWKRGCASSSGRRVVFGSFSEIYNLVLWINIHKYDLITTLPFDGDPGESIDLFEHLADLHDSDAESESVFCCSTGELANFADLGSFCDGIQSASWVSVRRAGLPV